jgi:hypothetical protein
MADSNNQQPTFLTGLMAGLNGVGSNPLFNIGMGLMSAARPFGNVGESLMQANQQTAQNQAAQQNLAINRINAQKAQAMWPMYQKVLERAVNGPQGGMPQAPQSAPQGQPPPNQYRPPAPLAPIGGDPVGDVSQGQAMSVMGIPGSESFLNSPKNLQAAQEFLTKQRQSQVAPQMSILDTIAGASNADQIVKSDPELLSRWQEVAPRLGLNPTTGLTPENARAFGRYGYNEFAGTSQLPAKPMPDIFDQIPGQNGQVIQRNRSTGAITEPIPQKLPTYSLEKQWDPTTGRDIGIMVQTSPGGSAAPAGALSGPQVPQTTAPRRPAATAPGTPTQPTKSGVGATTATSIDLGLTKPDDANQKAANFANYARSNVAAMKQMEDSGYRMPPTIRAAVIDAASSDDSSKLSQLFSQEVLAHKLSPDDMRYMAALMPVLQASGHSMSGARLTQSQMRTNFESLIPLESQDPSYLGTVADNRKHLYNGLLAQAGNAVYMPEFKDTLGADVSALQKSGVKGAPAIGTVSKGYKYIGGDPAKPTSWVKASGQ